ncbi:YopX family protein, partial [Phocaeicola plebeius]|uniref:YopX family protein n=1 Tax=Phocaeicola plebeius TaxID=310297 RepID=UPI001DBC31F5
DKNGKEIYEGDILMCIGERNDNKGRKYYRKVLFNNGAFGMTVPEYKCISALCNHVVNGKLNWEVIGNIYDNTELLEEKL